MMWETMAVGIAVVIAIILACMFYIVIFGGIMAVFAFWIWMLVDAAKRNFKNEGDKVAWILIIILIGFIGATLYYLIVKRKDKKKKR